VRIMKGFDRESLGRLAYSEKQRGCRKEKDGGGTRWP
jgi:hypothetical protein